MKQVSYGYRKFYRILEKIPFRFSFLLLAFFCLQACSPGFFHRPQTFPDDSMYFDNLIAEITEELSIISPEEFSPGQKLFIATFVDLNNLQKTSAFGRLLSERLMTSMGNLGFYIIEPRKGPNIYIIEKKGEMILTRDKEKIPDKIQAGAIIYGTYVVLEQEVLVTARMARASDFMILKSWNGKIPRVSFVENLLGDQLLGVDVYERMPRTE